MTDSEYEWFSGGISRCNKCGKATIVTDFEHDPDCLLNIPGKHATGARFWQCGRDGGELADGASKEQEESFRMGERMREKIEGKESRFCLPDSIRFDMLFE